MHTACLHCGSVDQRVSLFIQAYKNVESQLLTLKKSQKAADERIKYLQEMLFQEKAEKIELKWQLSQLVSPSSSASSTSHSSASSGSDAPAIVTLKEEITSLTVQLKQLREKNEELEKQHDEIRREKIECEKRLANTLKHLSTAYHDLRERTRQREEFRLKYERSMVEYQKLAKEVESWTGLAHTARKCIMSVLES